MEKQSSIKTNEVLQFHSDQRNSKGASVVNDQAISAIAPIGFQTVHDDACKQTIVPENCLSENFVKESDREIISLQDNPSSPFQEHMRRTEDIPELDENMEEFEEVPMTIAVNYNEKTDEQLDYTTDWNHYADLIEDEHNIVFDDDIQPTFISNHEESQSQAEEETASVDMTSLKNNMEFICSISTFLCIIFTTGLNRCTARFFEFVRALFKTFSSGINLVTYKTVKKTIWGYLKSNCLPKSTLIDLRHPGKVISENHTFNPNHTVRIVMPSEWVKMDVRTSSYYNQLIHDNPPHSGPDIFKSKIFTHRKELNCLNRIMFVSGDNTTVIARPGDEVLFPVSFNTEPSNIRHWLKEGVKIGPSTQSASRL
ncbi:MAG: hypothetical protein AAF391_04065 [Bacteroidota bacterium]